MAKKYKVRGRPRVKKPKAPHTAVRNPQIPLDKLRKNVFWFSRNDGESKDIIYISTIHDVKIGRGNFGANLHVAGKITCDTIDAKNLTLQGLTWGLSKDTTVFPYDRQIAGGVTNYDVGKFNVFVVEGTQTYTYEDSTSNDYQKEGTYNISLSSSAYLQWDITTVSNQAQVTPRDWTGGETGVVTLNVTINAYQKDGEAVSAIFNHVYSVAVEALGGLDMMVTPPAVVLAATSAGVVSNFAPSACSITVSEGGIALTPKAYSASLTNGSFQVDSISVGTTDQSTSNESVGSTSLGYSAISQMTSDQTTIVWTLNIQTSDGNSVTGASVVQSLAKSAKGQDGKDAVTAEFDPEWIQLISTSDWDPTAAGVVTAKVKSLSTTLEYEAEGDTAPSSDKYSFDETGSNWIASGFDSTGTTLPTLTVTYDDSANTVTIAESSTDILTLTLTSSGNQCIATCSAASQYINDGSTAWALLVVAFPIHINLGGTTQSGYIYAGIIKNRRGQRGKNALNAAWQPQVIPITADADWDPTIGTGDRATLNVATADDHLEYESSGGTTPTSGKYSFYEWDQTNPTGWSAYAVDTNGAQTTLDVITTAAGGPSGDLIELKESTTTLLKYDVQTISSQAVAETIYASQYLHDASTPWVYIRLELNTYATTADGSTNGPTVVVVAKNKNGRDGTNGTNGTDGRDALEVVWSPKMVSVPAEADGTVDNADLATAAATFKVFQGATALSSESGTLSRGDFQVVLSTDANITAGSITYPTSATVSAGAPTSFLTGAALDAAEIVWTLTVLDLDGNTMVYTLTQNLTKSKVGVAGAPGAPGTSADDALVEGSIKVDQVPYIFDATAYSGYANDLNRDWWLVWVNGGVRIQEQAVDRQGLGLYSDNFALSGWECVENQWALRQWEYGRISAEYPNSYSYTAGNSTKIGVQYAGGGGGAGFLPMPSGATISGSPQFDGWAVEHDTNYAYDCMNPAQVAINPNNPRVPLLMEEMVSELHILRNNSASSKTITKMTISANVRVKTQRFTQNTTAGPNPAFSEDNFRRQLPLITGTVQNYIDCYLLLLDDDAGVGYLKNWVTLGAQTSRTLDADTALVREIEKVPYIDDPTLQVTTAGGQEVTPAAIHGWGAQVPTWQAGFPPAARYPARLVVEYDIDETVATDLFVSCTVECSYSHDNTWLAGQRAAIVFAAPPQYQTGANTNMPQDAGASPNTIQSNPWWQVPYIVSHTSDSTAAGLVKNDIADLIVDATTWAFGNYAPLTTAVNTDLAPADCSDFKGMNLEIISFDLSLTTT